MDYQGICALLIKKNLRTVSRLAEYIELAVHLRSNSNWSPSFIFSSSRRVEQKEGLYEGDFYLEQIYARVITDIERSTHHAGLYVFKGPIHKLFHFFLPSHRIFPETGTGHP